jgi:hypothetical protein
VQYIWWAINEKMRHVASSGQSFSPVILYSCTRYKYSVRYG